MLRALVNPFRLLWMLPTRPREFWTRTAAIVSSRWEASRRVSYQTTESREARKVLSQILNADSAGWFLEPALAEIRLWVREEQASLCPNGAFHTVYNGDSELAGFCYAVTRALRAKRVVETGVCYGVTSAYILQAMQANGEGHLDSIDVPPLGKDPERQVGRFIPDELRSRWALHRDRSARVLRPLLRRLGSIDLFVHDSQHTYRNMRDEFAAAWPFLRPGGALISDDVQGNTAFHELAGKSDVAASIVVEEQGKSVLFGVAVKQK